MTQNYKTCSKCGLNKLHNEFSRASGGRYLRPECRACEKELGRIRKLIKESAPPIPDNHCCPICGKNEQQVKGKGGQKSGAWCCDHDHSTNSFRGWICHDCNRALGNFKDSIDLLKNGIEYLERTKKPNNNPD